MSANNQTWFVYILQCNDGSYYVGIATDVEDRVREHNAGQGSAFTKIEDQLSWFIKKNMITMRVHEEERLN